MDVWMNGRWNNEGLTFCRRTRALPLHLYMHTAALPPYAACVNGVICRE